MLLSNGEFNILPYKDLSGIKQEHISLFCVKHGMYCLPTQELIDFLKENAEGYHTIEIGAGNGVIAKALNITATDSYMQKESGVATFYNLLRQTPVQYGNNVRKMDALIAVEHFCPDAVVASWLTHLYNPKEHWREGNIYGVDEGKIFKKIKKYIFVGNENVHKYKPILDIRHETYKPEWLLSRSLHKDLNVIYIWNKNM
jgi:hypothetical protein